MTLDTVIAAGGRVYRAVMHVPTGLATAYLVMFVSPVLGAILAYGFFRYEKNEDRYLHDQAWKDLYGYEVGVLLGGVIWHIATI